MGLETEIKAELPDYAAYVKIYTSLGVPSEYLKQENIYLDTKDRKLHSLGVMFRMRLENDKKIFTVKFRSSYENGLQKSIENEKEVTELNWSATFLNEMLNSLCDRPLPIGLELIRLGSLLNSRVVFDSFFGTKLELDHMQISDKHFFEIEIETNDPDLHMRKLKELLDNNQIPFKPSISKYGRFLQWLSEK